jgi:anaerobic ribonucleoside-triphosphate reductase activating protein
VEGVTISGGEPFDQPEGLLFLLKELRVVYSVDILVYSGYEYEILTQKYPDILTYIDAIITGGFEEKQENHLALRGSDNQQLHLLTEVAKSRFHKTSQNWVESEQRIQLAVSEDKMALLGIPSRGEWQKIQKKLSMKGLQIENL